MELPAQRQFPFLSQGLLRAASESFDREENPFTDRDQHGNDHIRVHEPHLLFRQIPRSKPPVVEAALDLVRSHPARRHSLNLAGRESEHARDRFQVIKIAFGRFRLIQNIR